MRAPTFFVVAGALSSAAYGFVTPTGPSPGQSFKEGGPCTIEWTADATGTWKTTWIELMTGDNFNMVHLTTVGSIDGTDATNTSLTWTCPAVTLHAPIYFYQFTSTGSGSPEWTGRFSITGADGTVNPAPNKTQPGGQAIPWGTGALVDAASAVPPPPTSPQSPGFTGATGGNTTTPTSTSSSNSSTPTGSAGSLPGSTGSTGSNSSTPGLTPATTNGSSIPPAGGNSGALPALSSFGISALASTVIALLALSL